MRKSFTLLFTALLTCTGVAKAQTIVGLTEIPATAVDLSTTDLTTGYYLIKQTNTAEYQGFLKATDEANGTVVTPNGEPTANAATESTYIWYVEVADDGKFSIATANKVAAWQAPTQKQKNLVAYDNKATTLELEKNFAQLNGTTQTLIKAWWEEQNCYSYVHASGHNLGSWNDQNTASLFYIEFYAIDESNLIIYGPEKLNLLKEVALAAKNIGRYPLQADDANGACYLSSCGNADGNIENYMLDGNNSTFYGSPWLSSVADIDYHYWQVDLGEGVSLNDFVFSYTTRANGNDMPTGIIVRGSTDGTTYEDICTITENLPASASTSYTSETISPEKDGYRYIRFCVTGTNNSYAPGSHETQRTIAIAEFALYRDESAWTKEDKALIKAIEAAQAVLENKDATIEDCENAIRELQSPTIDDSEEGPETKIDAVEAEVETVIYDLTGRRVEKMEKGIYIVNGKKVVIK